MKQYTATANDDGVRLSRFVQSVTRDFPTSLLYKSFRNKRVKVNGKKAVPEYRIQAGDLIELYIKGEFFPIQGRGEAGFEPEAFAQVEAVHGAQTNARRPCADHGGGFRCDHRWTQDLPWFAQHQPGG